MTNKKFLFIGMAVLLSASLFFLGCDTGGDEETTEKSGSTVTDQNAVRVRGVAVSWGTDAAKNGASFATAVEGTVTILSSATGESSFAGAEKATVKATLVNTAPTDDSTLDGAFTPSTAIGTAGTYYLYLQVTAENGTVKWFKITVTVLEDVKAAYTLMDSAGDNITTETSSGIEIDTAGKDATGKVTITLKGTFDEAYLYRADGTTYDESKKGDKFQNANYWLGEGGSPKSGVYSAVNIKGLVPSGGFTNAAVKRIEPGLVFYTGKSDLATEDLTVPVSTSSYNVYLPTDGSVPYKWKVSGAWQADAVWGFLLYDAPGVTNKTVTLEIIGNYDADTGTTPDQIVEIDYSAVIFPAAPPPAG
jgi:hypothetical protein